MRGYGTWTVSLVVAGVLGAAAPAHAQEGAFGEILGDILGQDQDRDERDRERDLMTEQAAQLCLDYAEDQVENEGGDDVRLERLVDADVEGHRVWLEADMTADYSGRERSARVECEVDFDGDDEVVAFRQLGEAGSGGIGGVLGDIFGQDDDSSGQADDSDRLDDGDLADRAARLCLEYAHDKVRDNGGQQVRMERLVEAHVDGDRVWIEAEMTADYGRERREARVECEVDFAGRNEVVAFRQR